MWPFIPLIGLLALFPTDPATLTVPVAQAAQITPDYATSTLRAYAYQTALDYGINADLFVATGDCESNWNYQAFNRNDPDGGSKGIFQFLQSTFDHAAANAGIENPDIWNPYQQIQLAALLFSEGHSSLWTCARTYDREYRE